MISPFTITEMINDIDSDNNKSESKETEYFDANKPLPETPVITNKQNHHSNHNKTRSFDFTQLQHDRNRGFYNRQINKSKSPPPIPHNKPLPPNPNNKPLPPIEDDAPKTMPKK
eukprot:535508_1